MTTEHTSDIERGNSIGYIRQDIPSIALPTCRSGLCSASWGLEHPGLRRRLLGHESVHRHAEVRPRGRRRRSGRGIGGNFSRRLR